MGEVWDLAKMMRTRWLDSLAQRIAPWSQMPGCSGERHERYRVKLER